MIEEEKKVKEKDRRMKLRLERKLYNLRKDCVDRFIKALEGISYHAENIVRSSGYFIFYMGKDSVIKFNIKELPEWRFGLWLSILDGGYINLEFFTQFELDIDKFKPSRSIFVENIKFKLDKTGTKLYDYNDNSEINRLFNLSINSDIKEMLNFIKNNPYRAWAMSSTLQGYKYSIPWSNFKCWCKYHKHKYYIEKENRIQDKYDKILINWILKNLGKYFEDIHLHKLEHITPSYEFYAPLSKNRDFFSEKGLYGMFYSDDECKDVLENPKSSEKELDLANKNNSLIREYRKLNERLQNKAHRKNVGYIPEVVADIRILKDKDYQDMRREAEVEVKLGNLV